MTRTVAVLTAAGLFASAAHAQYTSGFETMTANPQGVSITGQDGYYLPAVAGSTDFEVYTYAGNAYTFPLNPTGGTRFIAGTGEAGGTFERAQRDMSFAPGAGLWTISYDILAAYTGTLPSAQNIGSVSLQPFPGSQSFIALATWADPATAAAWNADYIYFNAAGGQVQSQVPDPGFQNLQPRQWYRWSTTFNLSTNEIVQMSITGITVAHSASHNPTGWYMEGGTGGSATPTGFRFFAGGGVIGNTLAFDNMSVIPSPGTLALVGLGGLLAMRRRR